MLSLGGGVGNDLWAQESINDVGGAAGLEGHSEEGADISFAFDKLWGKGDGCVIDCEPDESTSSSSSELPRDAEAMRAACAAVNSLNGHE